MTRKTILAGAISLATLFAGAPVAFAHGWPGAGTTAEQYEVQIPAGAVPPGPARGELSSEGSRYRVRFEMPAVGPTHVTFWRDYRSGTAPEKFDAVITSDRGGTVHIPVEQTRDSSRGAPLFLGSADELAAFSRAVRATPKGARLIDDDEEQEDPDLAGARTQKANLIDGIELGAPSEIAAPDCRRLAYARFVVVALRGKESVQGLFDCAARGADLLLVGRLTTPNAGTDAFARLGVGTRVVPWGHGAVGWFPRVQAGIGDAVAQLNALGQFNDYQYVVSGAFPSVVDDPSAGKPKGVPGSSLVLVLLALYVAVIGPIGYFVGVRPRRAWLAWSWFPLVALGATIALAAVSTVWRGKPAQLVATRSSLLAPTGAGLENTDIRLQGSSSARYAVSVPWRDGDLRSVERGYRFGTPFAPPAGTLAVTDDRIAGRLEIDGLTVGRFGTAGVSWVQPVAMGGVEVARRGDKFTIANHMVRPIRRAVIRSATLCGQVDALPVGAERTVAAVDCERVTLPENAAKNSWYAAAATRVESLKPAPGAVLLVAEIEEPASVEAHPAVESRSNDIVMVRGPLPGEEPEAP
jgi:hypothetical protein